LVQGEVNNNKNKKVVKMAHRFYFNPYILDNLPSPISGFDVVQDAFDPRLKLYITSRGVKSFFVRARIAGRDRRIIIGNYPEMDIDIARERVDVVLKSAAVAFPRARKNTSFRKVIDLYMTRKVRRSELSRQKLIRSITRHLGILLDKNITDITNDDVRNILDNISGPVIRNRIHELLTSIFKFAIGIGYIKSNPIDNIRKVAEYRHKSPLTKSGMEQLVNAVKQMSDENLRAAFLMLIYGFASRSKVFSMRWSDLDFNQYTWNGYPLSDRAVVLLETLPQDNEWVFVGRGGNHLMDPRIRWQHLVSTIKMSNLTMDDVYKYQMRQLKWRSDREELRNNMNNVLA
jgi:hypothetical protein